MENNHRDKHRFFHNHDNYDSLEPMLSIILSETELYFIDDSMSLRLPSYDRSLSFITGSGKLVAAPLDLIEEVGTAIAEIVATGNKIVELEITFIHAMILREIADTRVYIDDKPVGLTLKRKLHALLYNEFYENKVKTKKLMKGINKDKNNAQL